MNTVQHARIIIHVMSDPHASCHAVHAHAESARDCLCPEPGFAAACSVVRVPAACVFLHALFSLCLRIVCFIHMQHGMLHLGVSGLQDPISGPIALNALNERPALPDAIDMQARVALLRACA